MSTVVVVDDEVDLLNALKGILEDEGYEVVSFVRGAEALAYMERQPPDLVLMDVMMPFMNGIDVLERMRELPRLAHTPVIMMSAAPMGQSLAPRTAQGFLAKPFDLEHLLATVRDHLR